jgi:hypothetical protein
MCERLRAWKISIGSAILFSITIASLTACSEETVSSTAVTVVLLQNNTPLVRIAAKEIRRYAYLRSGELPVVREVDEAGNEGNAIWLAVKGDGVAQALAGDVPGLEKAEAGLVPSGYLIRSMGSEADPSVVIVGGDAQGVLYGAYRFLELQGIRFYLHGDVIPDEQAEISLEGLKESGEPLFELRGILPFTDFPEGPDFWSLDDYKAYLSQLPKLGMNFFSLHTYNGTRAEPTVWVGLQEDVDSKGRVGFSYPSRLFNTAFGSWGYQPKETGDYRFGASALYDVDDYAAPHMKPYTPRPETVEDSNGLFDDYGAVLGDAFALARGLGIKICIGTETPLNVVPGKVSYRENDDLPEQLKAHLAEKGIDHASPEGTRALYEGTFTRIIRTHPLDYYWLWTPEKWIWEGNNQAELDATVADMEAAIAAAEAVDAPFSLATAGWVLGPEQDRALFDATLPKEMPVSAISKLYGRIPIDAALGDIEGRPKWAIPWIEDDPKLLEPQLWVGRMRRDAMEALAYGCTGLMGLHWRTRVVGPNLAALAAAAWRQDWPGEGGDDRNEASADYYRDWAGALFGEAVASEVAEIFTALDGDLPAVSEWVKGPGGLTPLDEPWEKARREFDFVEDLETLRTRVEGDGNLERFDYWLNQFRYMRATQRLRTLLAGETNGEALTDALAGVYGHLLATVTNSSDLGTIVNWEQHALRVTGVEIDSTGEYLGSPRLIVPTARGSLERDEDLRLRALVLAGRLPSSTTVKWRPLGDGDFRTRSLGRVGRNVFSATVTAAEAPDDIEYYIEAEFADEPTLRYPVTAPRMAQTVIRLPGDLIPP